MILFFPQYQAGAVPSHIPVGTPSLRALWRDAPGFTEVPLQKTDETSREADRSIHYRSLLKKQLLDAMEIVEKAHPDFILTTGGDCGASFAPIAYLNEKYNGKIGVIWIDAHADIHTPTTTPSKNYHGMVVRHLLGDLEFAVQPRLPLKPSQIAYLGLRNTEAAEDKIIAGYGIPRYSAKDVMGGNAPMDAVLEYFQRSGITHIHLHVDCDVLDEKVFPHVEVPEPGGLTLERLIEILQYLRARMPVSGCCLTEYAPRMPGDGLDDVKRIYAEGLGLSPPGTI